MSFLSNDFRIDGSINGENKPVIPYNRSSYEDVYFVAAIFLVFFCPNRSIVLDPANPSVKSSARTMAAAAVEGE